MPNKSSSLDHVFTALGDPTRRAVLARLCKGPATVSDLAAPFPMALPSFVQHLRVLEDSGLITSTKTGRIRTCQLKVQTLNTARHWLDEQRALWEKRLDRLDDLLLKIKTGDKP